MAAETSNPKFPITREHLAAMADLAVKSNLDTSKLTWTETQQALTLHSLIELLKTYGLEVDFELDIKDENDKRIGT